MIQGESEEDFVMITLAALLMRDGRQELAREVWAETVLTRAFRNILASREWTAALTAKRCGVLAERLARAGVAALKERHLLGSGKDEDDEQEQGDPDSDGSGKNADAG